MPRYRPRISYVTQEASKPASTWRIGHVVLFHCYNNNGLVYEIAPCMLARGWELDEYGEIRRLITLGEYFHKRFEDLPEDEACQIGVGGAPVSWVKRVIGDVFNLNQDLLPQTDKREYSSNIPRIPQARDRARKRCRAEVETAADAWFNKTNGEYMQLIQLINNIDDLSGFSQMAHVSRPLPNISSKPQTTKNDEPVDEALEQLRRETGNPNLSW